MTRPTDAAPDADAAGAPALVRPATPADVTAVGAIEQASFTDPWSPSSFRNLLGHGHVAFRVAERAGAVVGYSVSWFAADEMELANVAVAAAARGLGVGACLLDAALGEAAHRGAAMVYLEVRESNAAARRLYASRHFAEVGRRKRYYRRPTEDALVLARPVALAVPPPPPARDAGGAAGGTCSVTGQRA